MNPRKSKKTEAADVVADLQARARQAQELAAIPRQDLLSDPRLNPATRQEADRLQAERLATRLDLEHKRYLRAERETDRRAEERLRALRAVDEARAATDEAYTVLDMARSRSRYAHLCLGASLLLSVGSAMGLETAVQTHYPTAATGAGYIAEVALTGMSTAAILWAGKLARAERLPSGPMAWVLGSLIVVPLLVSAVGATIGSGPVGAISSLGAAAFSVLAYLVSVTAAEAIAQLVQRIDARTGRTVATEVPADEDGDAQEHEDDDRSERRELPPLPRRSDRDRDALEVVGEEIADQAASYLRSHGAPSERSHEDDRPHGDTDPDPGQVTPSERPSERALTAPERRRQEGIRNRRRVADYLSEHPDAQTAEIAEELGLGQSTVRRIRKELEEGGAP